MLDYKRILLATDLSETSEQVAIAAAKIAKQNNAELHIIHVMEHSPVAYGGEFSIPIDVNLEQSLEASAREALASLGEKYQVKPEHQHLESGSVKLAVKELTDNIKPDLIVVGTHGHHGIDVLLGSRANAILHIAPCDVMVIRIKSND
jgi:universal stress protein A